MSLTHPLKTGYKINMALLDALIHPVRELKRHALLREPFPDEWRAYLEKNVAHYAYLTPDEKTRLHDDLRVFVAEKDWEFGGNNRSSIEAGDDYANALTDEMKVTISAQACLLLLGWNDGRRTEMFPNVATIIVYPTGYKVRDKQTVGIMQITGESGRLGEAWGGDLPVVLSWQSAREGGRIAGDGSNVVLHEFAHKLDMQSDGANGVPHLSGSEAYDKWAEAFSVEFAALKQDAQEHHISFLDYYGATNEAEFFAVATEAFFEKPVQMRDEHAALYESLHNFYEQDTAARIEAVTKGMEFAETIQQSTD